MEDQTEVGWLAAVDVVPLIAADIAFVEGAARELSSAAGGPAIAGLVACADNFEACQGSYVLGLRSLEAADGENWVELILENGQTGWLRLTALSNNIALRSALLTLASAPIGP